MGVPVARHRVLFLTAGSLAIFVAACGGGGSEMSSSTATSVVATIETVNDENVNDETGQSTTVPLSSSAATTSPEDDFDLADLPGHVVFEAIGCGSAPDRDDLGEALIGADGVDEAVDRLLDFPNYSTTFEICVMKPDGSGLVRVSEPDVDAGWPGLTYDGSTVIYRADFQWFVVGLDGSNLRRWEDPANLLWRVSPDGTRYVSTSLDDPGVISVSPVGELRKGPGRVEIVPREVNAYNTAYRWSPDGRFVLYHTGSGDCFDLWKVDVVTLERFQLTGAGASGDAALICAQTNFSSWSPDGSTITVMDFEGLSSEHRPYLIDADGTNLRPLFADGYLEDPEWMAIDTAWSPDGRYIMIDVASVSELQRGEPTLRVVRVADGLVKPIPLGVVISFIDIVWMPEAPSISPGPEEDVDAI
jgi:hypothetical protein